MLHAKGVNFNDAPTHHKRGRCVLRETYSLEWATRHRWIVDNEIPIFTKDREYIERHLAIESEAA
jgi:tRNA(His) 5'-end guanylyltransferase